MIIESESRAEVSNTRPARAFRAARDAVWEFSNNQHLGCQVHCKRVREILESNLSDTQCDFCQPVAIQTILHSPTEF